MPSSTPQEPPRLRSLPIDSPAIPSPSSTHGELHTTIAESIETPAHRSHDLSNNLKRNDPFKFGSRFLQEDDNVYEFNAWDHVTPDDTYYAYAEVQYANQRASPVSDFDKRRFNSDPAKWWNTFYSNNTSNFFKNRKWLHQEFPILSKLTARDAGPAVILEVGAGAGNTAFPILTANENPELVIHACDFSSKAVDLIQANDAYDSKHIQASVWDISGVELPLNVREGSVDVVLLIFIFSALSPLQWNAAVRNVWRVLKAGGEVCFRDYGRGDLTQVRFRKGRYMEEGFYIRGDGTRVYFFDEEELIEIWSDRGQRQIDHRKIGKVPNQSGAISEDDFDKDSAAQLEIEDKAVADSRPGFDIISLGVDRRMLVNRQKQLKMYRCWMQGRFKKPNALID